LEGNYFRPLAAIRKKRKLISPGLKELLAQLKTMAPAVQGTARTE
jgi:hypothetical protein